jgi:beta-xylosidase
MRRRQFIFAIVLAVAAWVRADEGNHGAWGDQGDGTYKNPVLPADYSDIDCIRVGPDYYAISSTFQSSPGVVILHSKDLVNWSILGHAVLDVSQIGPEMNWNRMNRYGKGVWAGSIRYHAGRFWIYFGTPDEGFFMTTAKDPAGPWEQLHAVMKTNGWDDCCPFWDDDGQGYLVCTQFAPDAANGKKYNIHLFKLTPDGRDLLTASDTIIHQSNGSEASKLYKFNGVYFHLYSEVKPEGRVVMMNRSTNLYGPYETKQLNHATRLDREPNQGGLVQTENGGWYFLTHQGKGGWEGRPVSLLPVTWLDGWPIIGVPGSDGIGNMVWSGKKPVDGFPITVPQSDDEFTDSILAPQWEWNYQPRADKWSLTGRPGFLRLYAFKPLDAAVSNQGKATNDVRPDAFRKAGNTLTQRIMGYGGGEVITRLDVSGMADGQTAGLVFFYSSYCRIGVVQSAGVRAIEFNHNGNITSGPVLTQSGLWLKAVIDDRASVIFARSLDGKIFTPMGDSFKLDWANYRGSRVGLYSFNNLADTGYVDVDWFHYAFSGPA